MGNEVGRLLRRFREARSLSQAQLSEAAQVATGTIANWEAGSRNPSRAHLLKVAAALNLNAAEREKLLRAAGLLAPGEKIVEQPRPTFESFVNSDPYLTRRDKRTLIMLYESMASASRRAS
jgi:transcriptional regulator with XRE-family HTH domain